MTLKPEDLNVDSDVRSEIDGVLPLSWAFFGAPGDASWIALAVGVLVALLTGMLLHQFVWRSWMASRANTILLVGLNNAGKTLMFGKLINSKNAWRTYASMVENRFSEFLTRNGRHCELVDVPGAESIRKNLLNKWLIKNRNSLKCIIFAVDSAAFGRNSKDVAELLYDVIADSASDVPILVACNKQDLRSSSQNNSTNKVYSSEAISVELEREFGLINLSRAISLASTSGGADGSSARTLTNSGADFRWTELSRRPRGASHALVSFTECSAQRDGVERDEHDVNNSGSALSMDSVRVWIDSI